MHYLQPKIWEYAEFWFDLAQLIITFAAAIVVAVYWNWRSNRLAEYRYLDESYSKLLESYRKDPEFGDGQRTNKYTDAFPNNELKYHYFAMTVHNAMETIFDTYKSNIPPIWKRVFSYHTLLHLEWLLANPEANEPDYVGFVVSLHRYRTGKSPERTA